MFVVLLSYTKPIAEIDQLRPAHLAFLDRYYANNVFIASGRQLPPTGGLIIANAASREQLETILQEDPFYTEQAATYEVIEFTPNKYNPAFSVFVAG